MVGLVIDIVWGLFERLQMLADVRLRLFFLLLCASACLLQEQTYCAAGSDANYVGNGPQRTMKEESTHQVKRTAMICLLLVGDKLRLRFRPLAPH